MPLPRLAPLALAAGLAACTAAPRAPTAGLLELHAAQRRAHLAGDADAMAALLADGYAEVRDGVVVHPSRAETRARFARYFGAVEILAWDDLEPPEIALSEDGTLATMAVRKLVRTRSTGPDGAPRVERTLFAWLATCVRVGGAWRVASVASTRRPEDAAASLAAQRFALGGAALDGIARVTATVRGVGPGGEYALDLDLPARGPWRLVWRSPGAAPAVHELHGDAGRRFTEPLDDIGTPLTPAELEVVRVHAFPYVAWDLARFFPRIERSGTERAEDGRSLERLALTDPLGQPATAWIDLATDRIARIVLLDSRNAPAEPVTLDFEDWQTVADVVVPRTVTAHDARGAWRLELADVGIERD